MCTRRRDGVCCWAGSASHCCWDFLCSKLHNWKGFCWDITVLWTFAGPLWLTIYHGPSSCAKFEGVDLWLTIYHGPSSCAKFEGVDLWLTIYHGPSSCGKFEGVGLWLTTYYGPSSCAKFEGVDLWLTIYHGPSSCAKFEGVDLWLTIYHGPSSCAKFEGVDLWLTIYHGPSSCAKFEGVEFAFVRFLALLTGTWWIQQMLWVQIVVHHELSNTSGLQNNYRTPLEATTFERRRTLHDAADRRMNYKYSFGSM